MPEELAWCAGFFDGEGCVRSQKIGNNYYPYVTISQVDRRVLDRFRVAVGVGEVYGPYIDSSSVNKRPIHHYRTTGIDRVSLVFEKIGEHLGEIKREDFEQSMRSVEKNTDNRKKFEADVRTAIEFDVKAGIKTGDIANKYNIKPKAVIRIRYILKKENKKCNNLN